MTLDTETTPSYKIKLYFNKYFHKLGSISYYVQSGTQPKTKSLYSQPSPSVFTRNNTAHVTSWSNTKDLPPFISISSRLLGAVRTRTPELPRVTPNTALPARNPDSGRHQAQPPHRRLPRARPRRRRLHPPRDVRLDHQLRVAGRPRYRVPDGGGQDPVVDVVGVQLPVHELGQPVREHPEVPAGVHLDVVREHHRGVVHVDPPLRLHRVRRVRGPPAGDRVQVDEGVEQHPGFAVEEGHPALALRAPAAQHPELAEAPRGRLRVPQDPRADGELPRARQRVEVQRRVPVGIGRRQRHPEHPVRPLERHPRHVELARQRVDVEVVVLHPPRGPVRPRVHHDPRRPQVRDVNVAVLAVVVLHRQVREEPVLLGLLLRDDVPADLLVGGQVVDDELGRRVRLRVLEELGDAGVHHPEAAAAVRAHPERRDDPGPGVVGGAGQAVGRPAGVRVEQGRVRGVWK